MQVILHIIRPMLSLIKIPYLRLKYRFLPNKAQAFWGQELLNGQGINAKIGQILSQGKQTELPKSSLPKKEAQDLFKSNFHRDIVITEEPLAASMGQVFRVTVEGQDYGIKILHPGLKEKLQKEIKNLLLLGGYFAKAKGFHFDPSTFKRFLTEVFEEETNLVREAQFQKKFYTIFNEDQNIRVPEIIPQFSNSGILCQRWVPATLARDLSHFSNFEIFKFFFKSLLQHGVLHGDLNDRNWGCDEKKNLVVYDYGCSQVISERRIIGLKKLLLNQDVKVAFLEFGVRLEATSFKGKEQELRDALFNPILQDLIHPEWSYSKSLEEKFGDQVKVLRGFTDPWVLLMLRSLFSLIRVYHDRKVSIPLKEVILPLISVENDPASMVQIHIEISEDQKQVFYIPFPFSTLEDLERHVPFVVEEKLKQEGYVVRKIIEKAKLKGPTPQNLFDTTVEGRRYRAWID